MVKQIYRKLSVLFVFVVFVNFSFVFTTFTFATFATLRFVFRFVYATCDFSILRCLRFVCLWEFFNVAGLDFATVENLLNFDYFCDVLRLLLFFLTILLDFKFCFDFYDFLRLLRFLVYFCIWFATPRLSCGNEATLWLGICRP